MLIYSGCGQVATFRVALVEAAVVIVAAFAAAVVTVAAVAAAVDAQSMDILVFVDMSAVWYISTR